MASHITFFSLIGFILFSSSFTESSVVGTTPVLMWSNYNSFTGQNIQETNVVSVSEISAALRSESSSLSNYFNKGVTPEVVFVFVEAQLSTEQMSMLSNAHGIKPNGGAFSNIKGFVENSESSLVLPYVTSSLVGKELVQSLASMGSVHTFNGQPDQAQISNLLNNGNLDIVLVHFNSFSLIANNYAADDAAVASWIALANGARYMAIFTANGAESKVLDTNTIIDRHERAVVFRDTYAQNGDLLYTTNWPVGVVEAIFVMAPFIVILFIGVCCTMQIQSDLKFDAEKMILRKQL